MPRGPAFARRKDANHAEVREEYRRLGCHVKDIDFVADLFVIAPCDTCRKYEATECVCASAKRMWVEVKKDAKEPLTLNEREWQLLLGDQHVTVRSLEDVRNSVKQSGRSPE